MGTEFGRVNDEYDAYRPPYPAEMFSKIIDIVPPNRRTTAMDLGAGTGLSTLPLCNWFDKVIAIEPDEHMSQKISNVDKRIIVCTCTAEERMQVPSSIDLVISVNAFYWMDGPSVVESVSNWLRHDGVFAVCRYGFPKSTNTLIDSLLQDELNMRWNSFRHPRLIDEDYSKRCIVGAKDLSDKRILTIPNIIYLNPWQTVGFFKSTSYVSAYLRSLDDPAKYLDTLESSIKQGAGGSLAIAMNFELEVILAKKR